jgi:uncharacterized sulfatase
MPAGDAPGYHDIDPSPSKDYIIRQRELASVRLAAELALNPHGPEQLYAINNDPGCRRNLIASAKHDDIREKLRVLLGKELTRLQDPRVVGNGDVFESYPRFSPMRPELGGFAEQGKANPKYLRTGATNARPPLPR